MEINVKRQLRTPHSTTSDLTINGKFVCNVLEDVDRGLTADNLTEKIYGETAIPAGRYRLMMTYSPRFKRVLPELMDVPGFSGVRIHPGNTPKDTEGCLLVGDHTGPDFVGHSVDKMTFLLDILERAEDRKEEVFINIIP